MIKAAYGESVYHMLRAVAAISATAPEVMECNTILDETQIFEKVKHSPFIIPWCSMAYLSDPINNTFTIRGKDGQVSTQAFDMQNTMLGNLRIKISLHAATQEQITILEKTVVSFFTEPKELTIVDFPGFNGNFTTSLAINAEEETQRKVFSSATEGDSSQVYRTQINLIANRCVAPYLPTSQEKIDNDFSLQYHLIDRLCALNTIYKYYCQYLDRTEDFTLEQVQYIRQVIKSIPAARERIKAELHITEAYNNKEYSKLLRTVMENKKISAACALERIRHTRHIENSTHPTVRKQLIRDVKKALDIEQEIKEQRDTLRKLQALQFESAPPRPKEPEKEDFTDLALRFPEAHQQARERRKQADEFASKYNGFMGMQFSAPQDVQLSAQGESLYRQALIDFEQQKKTYHDILLPEYENRKAEWQKTRAECLELVELQVNEAMRQRLPHYEEIGFLPPVFQNLHCLSLIHQQLSTTNLPIQQILHAVDPLSSRSGQISALKMALDLSITIAEVKKQLNHETKQTYTPRPIAPVKQEVPAPVYPEIKTGVQFFDKERLVNTLFGGGNYFTERKKEVQAEEERIRNSPEYKQQCAAIDEEYRRKVAAAEEEYRIKLKQYHESVLPPYERGFAVWEKQHKEELASLKAELARLEKELTEHYEATKIIPAQYRRIDALRYIHDVMDSSNYSIAQAVHNYDMAVQRQIERERLEEEQRRADAEEARRDAEYARQASQAAAESRDSYSDGSSGGGGLINRAIRRSMENAKRDQEMREEMRRQERMKKDYYNTPKCQRYGLHGKKSCGGCPIAHMCKH